MNEQDRIRTVTGYHMRSKHRLEAYAAGPAALDWDDQPEPFRWFDGTCKIELPLLADQIRIGYADLYRTDLPPSALPLFERLSILLERSMGLAAWKSYGDQSWALRCNPSSGNLHPTEAYIITTGMEGLSAGVYHYLSRDHQLERRCEPGIGPASSMLPSDHVLVGLSSIHWREAWKYGERAFRYCQHDAGHAIAAISYAAAALGWTARLVTGWSDETIIHMLGLDRDDDFGNAEREHPDAVLWMHPSKANIDSEPEAEPVLAAIDAGIWHGRANVLSPRHDYEWPVIDAVSRAAIKPARMTLPSWIPPARPEPLPSACTTPAMSLFRQRRSAQHFDGRSAITAEQLFRMLDITLPRIGMAPWSSLPWRPRIHLVLFIHRVHGLRSGLYLFMRDENAATLLRESISRSEFHWQKAAACPSHLALYSLLFADCRKTAALLSCHQPIAGDSAFSLGMLAQFDATLQEGAWAYRALFWEAGMLGHTLYLEAEAAGVRATGIGCYFDDSFHQILGLQDTRLQSLYHFTVGAPLEDRRLNTLAPYSPRRHD